MEKYSLEMHLLRGYRGGSGSQALSLQAGGPEAVARPSEVNCHGTRWVSRSA